MKATEDESAALKHALKHEPVTPELRAEAKVHVAEADESIEEIENGYDTCVPGSWVAEMLSV